MAKTKQTKAGTIRALLTRPEGASLTTLCAATGWQPHSVRAALTGLRKSGCTIARETGGAEAGPVYRLTAAPEGAA